MELLIILFAILIQIYLTHKKLSPFLSLLIVSVIAGFLLGMDGVALLRSFEKGVGSTLGGLTLVICLGAVLGKILEGGGATEKISSTLINRFGEKNIQWAVLLTGFLIGIPLYYNAGFIILVPLVFSIASKAKLPIFYVAIPMAAALSTTHCFLPPHPSPVFLVNSFDAHMGKTLVLGLIITVPVVIIAGPFLGRLLKNIDVKVKSFFASEDKQELITPPATFPSFFIGLFPVMLITLSVISEALLGGTFFNSVLQFLGDPTIALLVSVLIALWYFGVRAGKSVQDSMQWVSSAISGISMILLIITAGGVFKQVLQDSGTDQYIASFSSKWEMPPLIFAWLVTAVLRVAIGSATVAGITAAGVVSPLLATGSVSPELMVLAVGTGSVFGSHVNDSGFWMFKEFFGLTLKQTFLSWTVMESLISILGLGGVLILSLFV